MSPGKQVLNIEQNHLRIPRIKQNATLRGLFSYALDETQTPLAEIALVPSLTPMYHHPEAPAQSLFTPAATSICSIQHLPSPRDIASAQRELT